MIEQPPIQEQNSVIHQQGWDDLHQIDLRKVLIVDDLKPNRRLMTMMFHNTEFEVIEADSAPQALDIARAENPFLVISDIQMPEMTGYDLCAALKADPSLANIAVIFVTAHHRDTKHVAKGLDLGADDFIYRPFQREELLARVRAVTRLKKAEAEARMQARVAEHRNASLQLLNQVGNALTSTLDTAQILQKTTQLVQEALNAEVASLWLLVEDDRQLVLTASSGPEAEAIIGYKLPVGEGIAGYVAQSCEPYFSSDVALDDKFAPELADSSRYHPQSILCVPLRVAGRVMGVIQALHSQPDRFAHDDLQLFQSVTNSVSIAVENARLFEEVQAFNHQLEQMVADRTRQLEKEKDRTWAILANMADALVVVDSESRVSIANVVAEELLNFRWAEVIGRPIPDELLEDALWQAIVEMAHSEGLTSSMEVDIADPLRPEGLLSIQAHASKIWDESGHIGGTVVVLRDVTALKEVERMKARFMAGVTHELKTPLAVIRTHANNLNTYYKRLPDRKRRKLLVAIDNQVKLLERLVGEILELARIDAGISLQRQQADLSLIMEQIVEELRPLADSKRLKLHWRRPRKPLLANVDVARIERVFRNLIDNAIKYTEKGFVDIDISSTVQEGQRVTTIKIKDTGIGIPPEHLGRIFDRFYRVDPSHTIPGTGLGLSIVKEIVDAHGGEIQAVCDPDGGTTFLVTLRD